MIFGTRVGSDTGSGGLEVTFGTRVGSESESEGFTWVCRWG